MSENNSYFRALLLDLQMIYTSLTYSLSSISHAELEHIVVKLSFICIGSHRVHQVHLTDIENAVRWLDHI